MEGLAENKEEYTRLQIIGFGHTVSLK